MSADKHIIASVSIVFLILQFPIFSGNIYSSQDNSYFILAYYLDYNRSRHSLLLLCTSFKWRLTATKAERQQLH